MNINNKRELKNIAINHSANIGYKDFVKIYRECTKEPYSFLTIDTTLSVSYSKLPDYSKSSSIWFK